MKEIGNEAAIITHGGDTAGPASTGLPAEAAQSYIREMLDELLQIAEGAQLKDVAALLKVTVTAVEINGRFL